MDKEEIEILYQNLRILRRTQRTRVLRLLKDKGPHTVKDLQEAIHKSQSETSQILKELRDLGLVEGYNMGNRFVEYSLQTKNYEKWITSINNITETLKLNKP